MDFKTMSDFNPRTIDKVRCLLDVLERMTGHPVLRGRFAMYGGTAINLFMLDVPRLSVDIDVTYIGSPNRDEMLAAKSEIERSLEEIAQELGYSFDPGKAEHAGRTFFLGYQGPNGPDNIKIDFTYLNRVPLLPIEERMTPARDGLAVPMLSDVELAGGKVKAYFSRVKVRDIYDVSNLANMLGMIVIPDQQKLFHKVILYDAALSAAFPFGFDMREQRFANRQEELEAELYPMLRASDSKPTLASLIEAASAFVDRWALPQDESEQEFLDRFAAGDFNPTLLFGEGEVASRAMASPEAAWKLTNLKKMPKPT